MQAAKTVLIVDDLPENITVVAEALRAHCKTQAAISGERALALINNGGNAPDLILLDIQMPGLDGYEVCRRIKANPQTAEVPVIFLTALNEDTDEAHGFAVGAVDFMHKPFNPDVIRARVATHLSLKEARDQLRDQNVVLERLVEERTEELVKTQSLTIHALASLAEARDNETGNHILRTQHYVRRLAEHLQTGARFRAALTDNVIEVLFLTAPLHDIGKVGIPDRILHKPGRLDEKEFEIMKTHSAIGAEAIASAEKQFGLSNSFLRTAREIALYHHERWDGCGYPQGLQAEAIPVAARLMAIADVYDALVSKRVYKPPFQHEEAVHIILEGRDAHFDPEMADAFADLQAEFREIAQQFSDAKESRD